MIATPHNKSWLGRFLFILIGQGTSLLGSGLVQFAIIWWLTRETGSPIVLTVATIVGLVPMIILTPLAGVVADRFNRKNILILADAFIALATLLMAVLFLIGHLEVWLIYVLLALRASGSAFHQPAFEAAMPLIAPANQLVRVSAIMQMIRSGVNLVSPLLGALLIEIISLPLVLMIDVVTALFAVFMIIPVPIPDVHEVGSSTRNVRGYMHDMREGIRYVLKWRGLTILILIFAFSNFLLSPLLALMPLIIREYFGGGVHEYSYFEIAFAIGLIIGSLSLTVWGGFKRKIVSINTAQIICGVALTISGFAAPDAFELVLLGILICGITSAYINSPAIAIVQSQVDPEMLGRVISIISTLCMIAMPISLAFAGPLAHVIGLMPMVYVPGIVSALVGVLCFLIPPLMNIENGQTDSSKQANLHEPEKQST
jgi:DHA3 family macrolide efflux protein-like MFS transporter